MFRALITADASKDLSFGHSGLKVFVLVDIEMIFCCFALNRLYKSYFPNHVATFCWYVTWFRWFVGEIFAYTLLKFKLPFSEQTCKRHSTAAVSLVSPIQSASNVRLAPVPMMVQKNHYKICTVFMCIYFDVLRLLRLFVAIDEKTSIHLSICQCFSTCSIGPLSCEDGPMGQAWNCINFLEANCFLMSLQGYKTYNYSKRKMFTC